MSWDLLRRTKRGQIVSLSEFLLDRCSNLKLIHLTGPLPKPMREAIVHLATSEEVNLLLLDIHE
jgi:hypothetical protein